MMKSSKAVGWFLLIFGLGIILWTLHSSYNVFTGKKPIPQIFKIEKTKETVPTDFPKTQKTQMEEIVKEMLKEQLKGLFPSDIAPQLLNLISWSIFAWIMISGGGKVATLGIKLIK